MHSANEATERRYTRREKTDLEIIFEQRKFGEGKLRLINISAQGCMVSGCPDIGRGERIELVLPIIGHVDSHLIWRVEERAGLHFERIIRMEEYLAFLDNLPTSPAVKG